MAEFSESPNSKSFFSLKVVLLAQLLSKFNSLVEFLKFGYKVRKSSIRQYFFFSSLSSQRCKNENLMEFCPIFLTRRIIEKKWSRNLFWLN